MDILFQGLVDIIKPMGFSGVVIAALAFWIFKREQVITTIQEARISDNKESLKGLAANSEALNRLTDALRSKVV